MDSATFIVLGSIFRVSASGEAWEAVQEDLEPFRDRSASDIDAPCHLTVVETAPNRYVVARNGAPVAQGSLMAMRCAVIAEINRSALEGYNGLATHAAVIAWKDVAVAIPGSSGAGKSTLAAACLRSGFGYVSDEALCLTIPSAGLVRYPKPLVISGWSADRLALGPGGKRSGWAVVRPRDLGATLAPAGTRLGHVVLAERSSNGSASIEAVGRSAVATTLMRYAFNHYARPRASFETVCRAAEHTQGWRLRYSDVEGAVACLHGVIADAPASAVGEVRR